MFVIGTAGHVDHGKTTLVQALTGMDMDRLREEKDRGLTVDLGFAWFALPSGREVSVVDVPGHQRFIKNMLAGAGGLDLAILVIAADEGPRLQTREHLAILDVLGVPSLVVALTKRDSVESEWIDLVEMEVEELLAHTRFHGAPVIRVAPPVGFGLDDLAHAIDEALDKMPKRSAGGRARLGVDRAFTMRGFGTVVTGTLVDGALAVGEEVEFQPGGIRGRVRGLHRHGRAVERLDPGTRAAVNVSGVNLAELHRGMVMTVPGALRPVLSLGVKLRAVFSLKTRLRRMSGVTVLAGTVETEARLRLLDRDELSPGDGGWAILRLQDPLPVRLGDRIVIRTPNETAAGAIVAMLEPTRRRVRGAALVADLERALDGSAASKLLARLEEHPHALTRLALDLDLGDEELARAVAELEGSHQVKAIAENYYATSWLERQAGGAIEVVRRAFAERPLQASVRREHLRTKLALDPAPFQAVVAEAVSACLLEVREDHVTLPGYRVRLSESQQAEIEQLRGTLADRRHALASDALSDPALATYAVAEGLAEGLGGGILFDPQAFRQLTEQIAGHLRKHDTISLAEARDLLGLSRRYAQAYLEHLDALGITIRVEDVRRLRRRS